MKRLSQKAKAKKLAPSEVVWTKEILELSVASQGLMRRMIALIHEHEDAASFKAKTEGQRKKVNETIEPGNPTVAAFCLRLDKDLERIEARRRKNLQRLKDDLERLAERSRKHLENYEGRGD